MNFILAVVKVATANKSGMLALLEVWRWVEGKPKDFIGYRLIGTCCVDVLKGVVEGNTLGQARVDDFLSDVALKQKELQTQTLEF